MVTDVWNHFMLKVRIVTCWKLQPSTTSHSSGFIWFLSTEAAHWTHRKIKEKNQMEFGNSCTDVGQLIVFNKRKNNISVNRSALKPFLKNMKHYQLLFMAISLYIIMFRDIYVGYLCGIYDVFPLSFKWFNPTPGNLAKRSGSLGVTAKMLGWQSLVRVLVGTKILYIYYMLLVINKICYLLVL